MTATTVSQSDLLRQLEDILDSDPCIDEVGFIHPSQFAALNEEARILPSPSSGFVHQLPDETNKPRQVQDGDSGTFFWHGGHKLGISTAVLFFLYSSAKDEFLKSFKKYKLLSNSWVQRNELLNDDETRSMDLVLDVVETEVMKHSRALLLLSCDFGTAWNLRKLVVSKKQSLPMFMDELFLSKLVLSYSRKSERAWSHRRWAIKMIAKMHLNLNEVIEKESELVKTIVENSKMNYRAWNHRCWLVSYMSDSQAVHELQSSRDWAARHVADNSCFHYRARLILQMVENLQHKQNPCADFHRILEEELGWVAGLIRVYVGREALWLHRRFLSLLWTKHLENGDQFCYSCCESSGDGDINMFVYHELELVSSSLDMPDNDFGDYETQATHAATYITWLAKQRPESFGVELQRSSRRRELEKLLGTAVKSCLWDSWTATFRFV